MPRAHAPGPSTLRNRNRVTNKTRLRIIQGNIDADPLAFDEDEEKARVVSTAGVDAEDANEHHLQAVLSAASQRHQGAAHRATRTGTDKGDKPQDAYIPIPDSTGVVEDYERWYAADRWRDPISYIKTSETVEEAVSDSLANGFTYYMDERDKEWLDKNNEEARGEGTSAQGALSTPGTTTRLSQRSSKAKGKEPDTLQPVTLSEDEFELVMGLFEKVTHEKTEFLHHGLEQGAPFPPFTDYQDTFASPLGPDTFAAFAVPSWIPSPAVMLRFAKVIYPYWKERRIERGGHRIIPVLNYDESDVKNESYICFRRRDVKAMRKTRASQASSSEKLMRLQQELLTSYELAKSVLIRERLKRESNSHAKAVWEKREDLVNLKRKFPSLGAKEDEELFYDKERVVKKPKIVDPTPSRARENGDTGSPITHGEASMRPKERIASIQASMDKEMLRMKERDHYWEDACDHPYQPLPVTFAQRHFQFVPRQNAATSSSSSDDEHLREWRAVRSRRGRGGVIRIDRRVYPSRHAHDDGEMFHYPRRRSADVANDEDFADAQEVSWRIRERWKFDDDDDPPVGPDGPDEQDRVLVDEFDLKYLRRSMSFYNEEDHLRLATDPTLYVPTADGRHNAIVPYRLGLYPSMRAAASAGNRPTPAQAAALQQQAQQVNQANLGLAMPQTNGTPISMQAQLKKMPSSLNTPQMRISSNGGMRPPTTPTVTPIQQIAHVQASPSQPATPSQSNHNGQHSSPTLRAPEGAQQDTSNGSAAIPDIIIPSDSSSAAGAATPMPAKPSSTHHAITMPNGYHLNGFNSSMSNGGYSYPTSQPTNGLTAQQLQSLKSVFTMPNGQEMSMSVNGVNPSRPASYIGHVVANGANYSLPLSDNGNSNGNAALNMGNMNLKLPTTRQMQWAAAQVTPNEGGGARRPPHLLSPQQGRASPVTVGHGITIAHSLSPILHNPVPGQQLSPPRAGQTPAASPSLHQQVVGGAGQGY
ncbi:hypothetical protein BV25DRAFT_1812676 [Artomyces pyxidatus]|uniref:Uncharacterized protein n=1 Tax=Artomyces pyxidatus TaxID=48021 RepID=A0ACB8SMU5_9AGAM|nr:hypothetical protein BV25DRAFT_1812676 [Artomyces pyxidatus]